MKLTIERLGHLGDGIAIGPAGPIFVPLALPGEVVEGEAVGDRIAAARIVTPSSDRVRAACPHYPACGGCSLMHAADPFVAAWKVDVVRTALSAQSIATELLPVVTSPPRSRRRAVLSGRRTKKGALIGFHARASDTLIPISACQVLRPELVACLPALNDVVIAGASRKGEMSLTVTLTDSGVALMASGGKPLDQSLFSRLAEIAEASDLTQVAWEGDAVISRRPATQHFGRAAVIPPPGAFLQATREGEAALLGAVRMAVGDAPHLADLFAGAGTFALPLAERAEVFAVEGDAQMVAALDAGWRRTPGLKRVTVAARDLFRRPLLADELARFDAVVIDPPRAGAEAQMHQIAASRLRLIAAVSCNPVTFARDARILCDAGFALDWVQVVDQFRWSTHVELAARFSRC